LDYLTYPININKTGYVSGMDSLDVNKTPKYLEQMLIYPYPIYYQYNSRGFRGKEWPQDLSKVLWCVGDSFTSGIGVPFEHTWPSILQYKSKIQCINLGIDGAANRLLVNIAKQVIHDYAPKYLAIMWTFPHRRYQDPWKLIHYRDTSLPEDLLDFKNCFDEVNSLSPYIYNTIIPDLDLPIIEDLSNKLYEYPILDRGRDNFHFDYLTAEVIAESIIKHFNFESTQHEKN
jgi:hypothetical protein